MSRSPNDDWTREDSRRLDLAPDSESTEGSSAAHLRAYGDAMGVWRDDTERVARTFDAGRVTRRILDAASPAEAAPRTAALRTSRRYAAAALVLIGLGAAGALALEKPGMGDADGTSVGSTLLMVEEDRFDLIAVKEIELFGLAAEGTDGTER